MYKIIPRPDGSFHIGLDYDLIARMSDDQFKRHFSLGKFSRKVFVMLQKIKKIQAEDNILPPKKRKLYYLE